MNEKEVKKQTKLFKGKNRMIIFAVIGILVVLIVFIVVYNKNGVTKTTVKSSLEKLVEKSDLETATFTYNVIAKKCKNDSNCDLDSNDIDDFKYVISCKGSVTAGIEFKNIKFVIDESNKKLLLTMPEATLKEVNVGSMKFLNGEDIPANEFPNARELCQKAIDEKSKQDDKLLVAAQEQASVVLESFYEKWLKAYGNDYKVEIN